MSASRRWSPPSTFPSREAMEQLVNMGMQDGMRAAMAQMDEILAG